MIIILLIILLIIIKIIIKPFFSILMTENSDSGSILKYLKYKSSLAPLGTPVIQNFSISASVTLLA